MMPFGLKNAPAIFSRIVVAIFKEFIQKFVEVYFDDWIGFGLLKKHVEALRLILAKCRKHHISLNLKKCIFCVPFGILLGHIVCRKGLMVDPAKIAIIVNLPPPNLVRQLCTTLGHTGYYRKFIKGYAQIIAPMEKLLRCDVKFQLDTRMLVEFGYTEREDGYSANTSVSRLEVSLSCSCRCFFHCTWSYIGTTRRRRT